MMVVVVVPVKREKRRFVELGREMVREYIDNDLVFRMYFACI